MPNGSDHDLLMKMDQKLTDLTAFMSKSESDNKMAHRQLSKKLDDQQIRFAEERKECSNTFMFSRTFWKIFGVIMTLVLGSFAYTSGVLAYLIRHITTQQ